MLDIVGRVGAMYELGSGVVKDFSEALRWYKAAAQQGNAPARERAGSTSSLLHINLVSLIPKRFFYNKSAPVSFQLMDSCDSIIHMI